MALVNPNIALAGTPMQVPNFLGMQQTAAGTQNTLARTNIMQEEAARASESAEYNTALSRSKDALRFVNTPEQYLAWADASFSDPVLGSQLSRLGLTPDSVKSSALKQFQQPGGFQNVMQTSAANIDQLAGIMGGRASDMAKQQQTSAANARAAQQNAAVQAILSGQGGAPAPATMAQPVPPPVNTLATPARGMGANALVVPPMSAAEEIAQTYAPAMTGAAPAAAPMAAPMSDPMAGAPAAVATEVDNLIVDIGKLRRLAASGNKQAETAANQLQKQLELLVKQDPVLSAADRFTPVGKNIFDKSVGKFIEPPTSAEVDELIPKLEKGERWNAEEGRVDAVPGSKTYIQQSQKHAKSLQTYKSVDTKSNQMFNKIDEILDPKNADAFAGNFGGYNAEITRLLPGENTDLRKKIDSFKSNMKAVGLELMRSGGSIGQMTEREWPIVEQMLGAIDPVLSEEDARMEFQRIKARVEQIVNNASDIYDTEWGETQYYKPIKTPANAGGAITVTAPNGQTYSFANQSAADQFKQAAGIQ